MHVCPSTNNDKAPKTTTGELYHVDKHVVNMWYYRCQSMAHFTTQAETLKNMTCNKLMISAIFPFFLKQSPLKVYGALNVTAEL